MDARLEASLACRAWARASRRAPLSGGDINEAYEVGLADGRRVFVKMQCPRAQ